MAFYRSCKKQSGGGDLNIDSFEVTTPPTTRQYALGDTLDTTGLIVTATAENLSGNVASDCAFSPTVFNTLGRISVNVSYKDKYTDSFEIICTDIGTLEEASWPTIQRVAALGQGINFLVLAIQKQLL